MAMGISVFRIRIELIFRLCWKLITPCGDPQRPPRQCRACRLQPDLDKPADGFKWATASP